MQVACQCAAVYLDTTVEGLYSGQSCMNVQKTCTWQKDFFKTPCVFQNKIQDWKVIWVVINVACTHTLGSDVMLLCTARWNNLFSKPYRVDLQHMLQAWQTAHPVAVVEGFGPPAPYVQPALAMVQTGRGALAARKEAG